MPVPPGFPPRQSPAGALEALARQIRGPGQFYVASDGGIGVLSLPSSQRMEQRPGAWWATVEGATAWPAADAPGAARRLAEPSAHLIRSKRWRPPVARNVKAPARCRGQLLPWRRWRLAALRADAPTAHP